MPQRAQESVEVQAPAADVFRYWSNVEEVRMTGTDTSHWKVKGPLGKSVRFEAKTTQMDPGRASAGIP